MTENRLKIIYSFAIGAIFAVLFVALSTIVGDLYSPHKDWLKQVFSHHWIGKGVLAIVIFLGVRLLISFFYFHRTPPVVEQKAKNALLWLFWITILSILSLAVFFILHFLGYF